MPIATFFSDLAEKLTHHPIRRRHPKAVAEMTSQLQDVVEILEKHHFQHVGTTIAEAVLREYKKTTKEELTCSIGDAFKNRDNGNLNIVGIVYSGKGDKQNIENHLAVQLDITPQGLTLPKSLPLKELILRIQNSEQDSIIEDIFDTLPRAPQQPAAPQFPEIGYAP